MKNVRHIFAALLFMLAHAATAQPLATDSETCSQNALARTAKQVQLVRKNLLSLPIGDGLQADVSPDAQEAIASMKNAVTLCASKKCRSTLWDKGGVDGRTKEARSKKKRGQRSQTSQLKS